MERMLRCAITQKPPFAQETYVPWAWEHLAYCGGGAWQAAPAGACSSRLPVKGYRDPLGYLIRLLYHKSPSRPINHCYMQAQLAVLTASFELTDKRCVTNKSYQAAMAETANFACRRMEAA